MSFGEDASVSRTGSGPANLATIRAAITAALKDVGYLRIPKGRRDHTTPAETLRSTAWIQDRYGESGNTPEPWFLLAAAFRPPGLGESGCEHGDLGFPGDGGLVAVAWGNVGRAFCARSECLCRPGTFTVCRAARAAESAAAVSASSDDAAVTWEVVMDRIA